jgi:hypothetical protein
MVSITSLNIISTANFPKIQESDAIRAASQRVETTITSDAADSFASGAGAGTNVPTTGFTATPRLSANVIDALLNIQSQQSTGGTSAASGTTTTLSGASEEQEPSATSSDSSSSDPASSNPPTLQQIAGEFDVHHLTHQQEEQLIGQLVSSGNLSENDGLSLFFKTVLADAFNSQHYRIINGQLVATTPSPPGTIIGNDAPGGPQYDAVQRFQQSLAADQYFGDTANASQDQKILNVLNQIDSIRNGGTA